MEHIAPSTKVANTKTKPSFTKRRHGEKPQQVLQTYTALAYSNQNKNEPRKAGSNVGETHIG